MSGKQIQAMFGQAVIDAISEFAKNEIPSPDEIAKTDLVHVQDTKLQKAMAETLYGARWLYKIGLALLTSDLEQSAHIRTQVIDYASVCETLLADIILQAHEKALLKGTKKDYYDLNRKNRPINWNQKNLLTTVNKTTFEWRIKVAEEEGIINKKLAIQLNELRTHRNTVHLTQKVMTGSSYYVGLAKKSYTTLHELIKQTKAWVAKS